MRLNGKFNLHSARSVLLSGALAIAACQQGATAAPDGGTPPGPGPGDDGGTPPGPGGDGGSGGGDMAARPGPLFPPDYVFNKDVSASPVASESAAIMTAFVRWGNGDNFDVTFDFDVFTASSGTPTATSTPTYAEDSDVVPFPVVPGGAVEGETGYQCTGGGDCHYLVIDPVARKLYELYAAAEISPGRWRSDSIALWHLDRTYGANQRGFGCTSADAAGFPITPGLIRVGEVVTDGEIRHALRFILPNPSMRAASLVPPASHYGAPSSANPNAPPYGIRLRLKSTFDESRIASAGGKVVVRALKRYGMLLSDGGQIALTAERDRFTQAKWGTVLGQRDLRPIKVADFDVVEFQNARTFTSRPDCTLQN